MTAPGPEAGRIGVFDGLRAFALFGVVVVHLFGISGLLAVGDTGLKARAIWTVLGNTIDLFFVISGFLLFLPVLRRGRIKDGTGFFLLRRIVRIQPEYWLCLVAVTLMIVFIPVAFQPPVPSPAQFLIHVFDLQTVVRLFDPDFLIGFWIDGALWMIPVILGLYLVFPPFSRMMLKLPWAALLLALAVTVGWKLAIHHLPGSFSWLAQGQATEEQRMIIAVEQSPSFFWSFAAGMFAAMLYQKARLTPGSRWVTWGLPTAFFVATITWIACGVAFSQEAVTSTTGFDGSGLGRLLIVPNLLSSASRAVLVLFVALGPPLIQRVFDNRAAAEGARLSYGLYLIHLPIAFYVGQLLQPPENGSLGAFLLWSVLVIPASLAWAWVSRRFVGKPAIDRTERHLAGRGN